MSLTKTLKALNAKRAIIGYIASMRTSDNIADLDQCEKGAMECSMAKESTKGTIVDVLRKSYVNGWTSTDPGDPGDIMRLKKSNLVTRLCNVIMEISADERKGMKANAELDVQKTIAKYEGEVQAQRHTLAKDVKEMPALKVNPKRSM